MIQEILAISLFALAIFYGIFQLGRFLIPVKKNEANNCGSGSCGCKP